MISLAKVDRHCDSCGKFYFCIRSELSESGEIYVWADKALIANNGELVFMQDTGEILLAFASGNWECMFAASAIDGAAVAVEHWKGEVAES